MNKYVRFLDKSSGILFFIGLAAAKLKSVPILFLSSCLQLVSLTAYLVGYLAWYIAALFYPEHPRKKAAWFGFFQFKEQMQLSAILGVVATMLCLASPAFILPVAWLYLVSNFIWTVGEYHKKENPRPSDATYSQTRQTLYFRYTQLITAVSGVTAMAATGAALFPLAAASILIVSTLTGLGLTAGAFYYWGMCMFRDFPPDTPQRSSYQKLLARLSSQKTAAAEPNDLPQNSVSLITVNSITNSRTTPSLAPNPPVFPVASSDEYAYSRCTK